MDAQALMQAAEEVARRSGDVALGFFRQGVTVDTKGDGTPVTVADRTAEKTAREWIESRFPEDGILGEEFGETRPGARRRWILDPIDGTKTFIRGVPLWGTLVAVAEGDRILAGAAYFPPVGELLAAAPGQGCFWNDKPVRVSELADLSQAVVLCTDERFQVHPDRGERWRALAARSAMARTWGDCYGYVLVATGRAEIMLDPVINPWDCAPLLPILSEAGGHFTDWRGTPTIWGADAVGTNALLHDAVLDILGSERRKTKG